MAELDVGLHGPSALPSALATPFSIALRAWAMVFTALLLTPLRAILGHSMHHVFAEDVRSNPTVVHAEAQSDDVGTQGGGMGNQHDGTRSGHGASGHGFRTPGETRQGFKPQYVVPLRRPRTDVEAQRLYNHLRTLAFYLDAIPFLGRRLPFNVGVDSIIGLIPGVGDAIGLLFSLYFVLLSALFGLPWTLLGMMLVNVVLDCTVGLIPLVGDALDVAFKANLRNLRLLEDHMIRQDGQCGAGTFTLLFPPSNVFMPKKGDLPARAQNGQGDWATVDGPSTPLAHLVPDGQQKSNWTSTKSSRRKDATATSNGGGGHRSDFRNGTMVNAVLPSTSPAETAVQTRGETDQAAAGKSQEVARRVALMDDLILSSWSVTTVPDEYFTTMRYEPNGISLAEMCQALLNHLPAASLSKELQERHKIPLWDRHMDRLRDAQQRLAEHYPDPWQRVSPLNTDKVRQAVDQHLQDQRRDRQRGRRIRVAVDPTGQVHVTSAVLEDDPMPTERKTVRLDPGGIPLRLMGTRDIFPLTVKTSTRFMYDRARDGVQATLGVRSSFQPEACFDVLMHARVTRNGTDILTESSIANLILLRPNPHESIDRPWLIETPATTTMDGKSLPFLAGIMRNELVERGILQPTDLQVEEVRALVQTGKAHLFLCNALRGTVPVNWVDRIRKSPALTIEKMIAQQMM